MLNEKDYNEMEKTVEDNVLVQKIKEYEINKNDIDTFYTIGKILFKNKITKKKQIEKISSKITASLEICVPCEILVNSLKFYKLINIGLIKSYEVKWDDYLFIIEKNMKNIEEINEKLKEIYRIYL